MSNQYPGGFVQATPPTVNAFRANGIWTLSQQSQYRRENSWPMYSPIGQQEFIVYGTYTWVAPDSVTSVSVVAVGGGGGTCHPSYFPYTAAGGDSYFINTSTVKGGGGDNGNFNTSFVGDGGGAGGYGGYSGTNYGGGGGGAGGYAGKGGNSDIAAATNSGGGGGGAQSSPGYSYGNGGGGVGIYGQGADGAYPGVNTPGNGGSGGTNGYSNMTSPYFGQGGRYGGGAGGGAGYTYARYGGSGGALAYKNNISVIPGQSYTVVVGRGGAGIYGSYDTAVSGANGAIRIIWPGATRFFPTYRTGNL